MRWGRLLLGAVLGAALVGPGAASEFPERECCDPVYPLAAVSASVSPETPTPPPHPLYSTRPGDEKSGVETLNCLLARQLCFEDPSCSPILETIPRVCGPESVSCSTVTVTKCQAALRTLQAFPFFKPTCLCREPQVDHQCNSFRNFLFDHPCIYVLKKEKDPYPIDALPTCNHALSVCQKDESCIQIFDQFKTQCKVRDGNCHMEDRELCHDAWMRIRLTPMFGCICPNNHLKKKCERIFSLVNHNPCIGSSPKPEENTTLSFQNTCHRALEGCNRHLNCKSALGAVTQYCNTTRCRRDNCMQALQAFYRTVDPLWSLEIAFCLCKKTKNMKDECLVAQELLHPVCAQQPEANIIPTCHSLAQVCNEDPSCRVGLENYEQACAVDSVTKQCAGPAHVCRSAMLGILGTVLRSNCACKGTDFSQLYECMGWQRVLWFNPCVERVSALGRSFIRSKVLIHHHPQSLRLKMASKRRNTFYENKKQEKTEIVESQRDFHAKKTQQTSPKPNQSTGVSTPARSTQPTSYPAVTSTSVQLAPSTAHLYTTQSTTPRTSTVSAATTTVHAAPTTTTTPSTTTKTTTTLQPTTTTSERPPPTAPTRYCVVENRGQKDYISEGDGKRIYKEGEPDCSDVCQCGEGSLFSCHTICVGRHPCKTDFAFYNHKAPAYQAYRGRCLCYSGRFICMRPQPDTYELPQGVFLFLGYSEVDEALLKNVIKMAVEEAVTSLNNLLRLHVKPKTPCMLSLFSMSTENIILVAKLTESNSTLTRNIINEANPSLLQKQKEECLKPLQEISDMINAQDPIVHTHLLLSIFKMAEVEVIYPAPSSNNCISPSELNIGIVLLLSLKIFLNES